MKADVLTVKLIHAISIYEAWASGPWRLASRGLNFVCMTCLMKDSVRMRTHIVRTVAVVFPYLCFGKKSHSWSNTEWRPDVLLRRLNGCNLEQFEASRHRGRSRQKVLIVQMDDAWTVECPDVISHLLDGCKRLNFTVFKSAQSLLEEHNRSVDFGYNQQPYLISIIT